MSIRLDNIGIGQMDGQRELLKQYCTLHANLLMRDKYPTNFK